MQDEMNPTPADETIETAAEGETPVVEGTPTEETPVEAPAEETAAEETQM